MEGPQISAPAFGTSQPSTPIFASGFHRSHASKDLVPSASATSASSLFKLGDSIKQPSSTTLTFGSFSNLGSSPGTCTSRESSSRGAASDMGSEPLFTFGTGPLPHERKSSAASSVSKPLFPIMPQSSSSTAKTSKPESLVVHLPQRQETTRKRKIRTRLWRRRLGAFNTNCRPDSIGH